MRIGASIRQHKFGTVLVALALGIGLAELVARVAVTPVAPPPRCEGDILAESDEPACGWKLVPGASVRLEYPAGRGDGRVIVHTVPLHGWRGAPFEREARDGVVRIACVGDSQMFGWGVEDGATFPEQLQRVLTALAPATEFEVLNLGVPNINIEEKVGRVLATALELDCDALVLQLFFDDDWLDGIEPRNLGGNARWLARLRPGGSPTLDFLRAHLRSVDVIADSWRRRLGSWSYIHRHEVALQPGRPARVRFDRALGAAAKAAAAKDVELVAVMYPMPAKLDGRWASASLDAQLCDTARRAGIAALDLGAAFDRCREPVSVHLHDHHASAAAHREAAWATGNFLRDRGVLARIARRASGCHRHAGDPPR